VRVLQQDVHQPTESSRPPATGSDLALSIRGLRKSYGTRQALDGLDLTVPAGIVYGFLGPNGAGKTTTMRLLTGLLHADGGTIEILGRPFVRSDRQLLFDVGALVETPSFYPYLSARANLRELGAAGARTEARRIDEVLELVGLRDRAREPVARFSLGMKQRLGIAGALLSDPKLLLLDEPANGLDPAGIVAMREMLRHLASVGKTVFVSSHLLAEVRQMADVVGIIASGRLVREGTMGELLGGEGVVRVRVQPTDVARATELLAGVGTPEPVSDAQRAAGWLAIRTTPDNGERVNRTLAESGLYASELHVGSDLEELFLSLTSGAGADRDGTFQSIATIGAETGERS
jgi:ABC-2 type transport system ATP-binding protein